MLRALIVLLFTACTSGDERSRDAGGDAGSHDAGQVDAGSDEDAGGAADGGADAGSRDAGALPALRVLSLNLHCLDVDGTPYSTNAARLAAVAERMVTERVDAALLQEVCDDGTTDALALLESEIETRTSEEWSSVFALAHVAWEGTAMEADEGVAILARGPLSDIETHAHVAQGALRRVTIEATLSSGLRVASFHLDHEDAASRTRQARELAVMPLVGIAVSANALLGGDLNDREGTAAHAALLEAGFIDATAELRSTRIDHVFVHRGAGFGAVSAELIFTASGERVSDHPGVLVSLDAVAPPAVSITEIVGRVDVGFGRHLTVRGDSEPLSWELGLPLVAIEADDWRWATTELDAPFAYKLLRDDIDWQTGENLAGTPGESHTVTPAF